MRSAILLFAVGALAFGPGASGAGRVSGSGPSGGRSVATPVRGTGFRGMRPPAARPVVPGNAVGVRTILAPYPVFFGGGYYPYGGQPLLEGGDAQPDYGPAGYSQQSPTVIINRDFKPDVVNPLVRDYSNVPLPEAIPQDDQQFQPEAANDDSPTIYIIAMKDRTIFATIAYWVDGEMLNYVTREGSLNHASLDLVDRDFSRQLNEERHVDFKLPAAK
jgi:hypothetical protein